MRSNLPKVLHKIANKPMLAHVIETAIEIQPEKIHVVIGHGADIVKETISGEINWALQEQQLGTGHAVAQALPQVNSNNIIVIAYGDVPLVKKETLEKLTAAADERTLALLTVDLNNPTGYGRIVRNKQQQVTAIVEQKDASSEQLAITEVNTGMLAVSAKHLAKWLPTLSSENAQGEYYLTDIISMAVADGLRVQTEQPENEWEVQGANDRAQVAGLERHYQQQQAARLMAEGASLADPNRIDVRGKMTIANDITIDINCIFIGTVVIGENVMIGPNCVIEDSSIAANTVIKANSVIEQATIGESCDIGPFARIRPGTVLANKAKIGNFVETKKAYIGEGSKVNHLSYIGDCTIGIEANIGAGTITCNYDGANKFQTNIGDGAFIGSNSALVAPVNIGKKATVAAGSTVTADVADEALAVARGKQRQIDNWSRPKKKQ
ncbi:MAG: bifunctional UDP-N-acetylglucosamine pyrophosphorylase/glucosamine-1-phosphate N-acetyltransferase [Pseudohongiellaceae bacterium]|jgi:bifunctional UDP-N-acetylglucosamine pyrophosphorylase/glucosamine-1-phosphate N-acetyltransferase